MTTLLLVLVRIAALVGLVGILAYGIVEFVHVPTDLITLGAAVGASK